MLAPSLEIERDHSTDQWGCVLAPAGRRYAFGQKTTEAAMTCSPAKKSFTARNVENWKFPENVTLLWPSVCFLFWRGIANARSSISAVEYTALAFGVVQLRATGTYASANPQKNLRRGQHAQG